MYVFIRVNCENNIIFLENETYFTLIFSLLSTGIVTVDNATAERVVFSRNGLGWGSVLVS